MDTCWILLAKDCSGCLWASWMRAMLWQHLGCHMNMSRRRGWIYILEGLHQWPECPLGVVLHSHQLFSVLEYGAEKGAGLHPAHLCFGGTPECLRRGCGRQQRREVEFVFVNTCAYPVEVCQEHSNNHLMPSHV